LFPHFFFFTFSQQQTQKNMSLPSIDGRFVVLLFKAGNENGRRRKRDSRNFLFDFFFFFKNTDLGLLETADEF
jgi:hypothetical protein